MVSTDFPNSRKNREDSEEFEYMIKTIYSNALKDMII